MLAAVVVSIGTFGAQQWQTPARPADTGAIAMVVLTALALAWRRRAPMLVLGVVIALMSSYLLIGYPYGPIQLLMVFAMFEAARQRRLTRSALACGISLVAVVGSFAVSRLLGNVAVPPTLVAFWTSWLIVPWSVGALVYVRATARRREQRELVARVALEERMRMAREVHDVAGHGFSAVAMQAGVALLVFDEQPKQARESLEAIQETSAKALTDLRTMLDTFNRGGASSENSPGLGDLEALAQRVRAGGLPVRLSVAEVPVPEDVDRTAYRVVQEALTNTLRHASAANAEVLVHQEGTTLVVDVRDDGAGAAELVQGRGLAGMRERVRAVGGELSTESPATGGFRVHARLPFAGEDTT